jgi:hypothetical protein
VTTPVAEQLVLPLDIEVARDAEPTLEAAPGSPVPIIEAEARFSAAVAVPLRPASTG